MFGRTSIAKETDRVVMHLSTLDPDSPEYDKVVKNLETLSKAQSLTKDERLSKDTLFSGFVNVLGIAAIVGVEHYHPVASKALSFVVKPRL